jgi:hypothetical protein
MKSHIPFALTFLIVSAPAFAMPQEIQAELLRLGGNLQTASANLDQTVEAAKVRTKQANATKPSTADQRKIVEGLEGVKTAVQAMVDFMHVREAALRREDPGFDSHIGAFQDEVKDLETQIADIKNYRYFWPKRKGTGVHRH